MNSGSRTEQKLEVKDKIALETINVISICSIRGTVQTGGVLEQGAEENIWT
jgi:hypothetical protein